MPTRKPPVTHSAIVAAARSVADASGVGGVSMRTVATCLGVTPMALYRHVQDKEALLDSLAESVFAEFPLPERGTPWRSALETHGQETYRVLSEHPWAPGFISSRKTLTEAALRHTEATLACLYGNGFSPAFAMHAISVLDSYVYGFVITEQDLPMAPGESIADFVANTDSPPTADQYPCLAALLDDLAERSGYVYGNEFTVGLELILDAIASRVALNEQRRH